MTLLLTTVPEMIRLYGGGVLWHGEECDEGQAMKLRLLVEFYNETKRWSAVFPELPGCASAGDTEEEAVRNAKEALELWFEPSEIKPREGAKLLEVSLP